MSTPTRIGKIELTTIVHAGSDDSKTGTKVAGYAEPKYGPFRCDNCAHYDKDKSGCDNTYVLKDSELKDVGCMKAVEPMGCCTYFRNKDADLQAHGTSEGAIKGWDTRGRGRHEGAIFVSPNEEEDTNYESAVKALNTPQHEMFHRVATKIITSVDHGGDVVDAIGDWSDGAEDSLVVRPHTNDPQDIKLMGAMLGLKGRQKYVIPWVTDSKGGDRLYSFTTDQESQQVRSKLDDLGVKFRTLAPGEKSTTVFVFDQGSQMSDTMQKVVDEYGEIKVARGIGEFFGDEDRNRAVEIFQQYISENQGQDYGRDRRVGRPGNDNHRSTQTSPLMASTMKLRGLLDRLKAYGTSEGVKKEWDERGRGRKTTSSLARDFGGLKVVDVKDLSADVVDHLKMKPPTITKDYEPMISGIKDAMDSLKGGPLLDKLHQLLQTSVTITPSNYEPKGAALTTVGQGGKSWLMLNTATVHESNVSKPQTVGGVEAKKLEDQGISRADAVREAYKWYAFHEFGHVLDNAVGGILEQSMIQTLEDLSGGDMKKAMSYLKKNVSGYATATPGDAVAEVVSMIIGGKEVPKELKSFERLVREGGE